MWTCLLVLVASVESSASEGTLSEVMSELTSRRLLLVVVPVVEKELGPEAVASEVVVVVGALVVLEACRCPAVVVVVP